MLLDSGSMSGTFVDEFDEGVVTKHGQSSIYRFGRPLYKGTPTACFDGGLLFRIVEENNKNRWSFYNDVPNSEMNVEVIFGPNSDIKALGNTDMTKLSDGSIKCTVVVYPLETELFIEGVCNGYKSNIVAKELTNEYLEDVAVQNTSVIKGEISVMEKLAARDASPDDALAACIAKKTKFLDLTFPPTQESLQTGTVTRMKVIPWERPSMFLSDENALQARLFRNDINPNNIDEGELGDSWFTGALACVAEFPNRIRDMFRHPRSLDEGKNERAIGAYRVTFNKGGWWVNVVVDDYLPCSGGQPIFARSYGDPLELWVSLAQKAYAKLYGGYGFLVVGDPLHALQDITGYPCSSFNTAFETAKLNGGEELFGHLLHYSQAHHHTILVTPTRNALQLQGSTGEAYERLGLLPGHVYKVLKVLSFAESGVFLLLLRNPWFRCCDYEWGGVWKKGGDKWKQFPQVTEAFNELSGGNDLICMEWWEVLNLFAGCGVCFAQEPMNDYRIRGCFKQCVPSVCLQISVRTPVALCFSLLQEDCRGTARAEFSSIMLSVAHGNGDPYYMAVELNSGFDADHPTPLFSFFEARETSMFCELLPENSPYLVVPRIISQSQELSYVLGIHSPVEIGTAQSPISVAFRTLHPSSGVFANCRRFEACSTSCEAEFQARATDQFFPDIYFGSGIQLL